MPSLFVSLMLAAAASQPTPAQGDLQGLFTPDDYPAIALENEEGGRVRVRLVIAPSGFVESCKVIESSGSTSLDEQTCAVIRARAQFSPAKDAKGRPIKDTYLQTITWRVGEDLVPPAPRNAWTTRTTLSLTGEGKMVDCDVAATGFDIGEGPCKAATMLMEAMNMAAPAGHAVAASVTDIHFYPVAPTAAPKAPRIQDATLEVRQVSRVVINGNGRVTECEGVEFSRDIPEQMDACTLVETTRFQRSPGAAELTATMVVTVYSRKRTVS
ncbi:energy transducer TonB [Sphingomonas sabuli]|uniref:Energy transducer TonB n=1 Tax=Sphingomonas sabuli TaxID=2764186 RepID=A0A7G9L2Z2_9SPHN|nr:energy transducer TonB [Sphingomonas sabuli]QNM82991.1 energy transducer TonB [Sphingomonas sabuli]